MAYTFEGTIGGARYNGTDKVWAVTIKVPLTEGVKIPDMIEACQDTTILVTIDPVEEKTYGGKAE